MKDYSIKNIRNISLLGHGGSGKTSVAEAMLYVGKSSSRLGKVSEGNTVCDFESEEIKRGISISASVAPLEWNNHKINIIDNPGFFDFEGEVRQSLSVSDGAVIVVSGKSGVTVGAEKSFKLAKERNLPIIFYVSKLDSESSHYYRVLDSLREKFGVNVCPLEIPIVQDAQVHGYVNLIEMRGRKYNEDGTFSEIPIPDYMNERIEPIKNMINEAVAETSEEFMNKFFAGETFTPDEIAKALKDGVQSGNILPVICGSATACFRGISLLLDTITNFIPAPDERPIKALNQNNEEIEVVSNADGEPSIFVFKTIADPFVGKMSFFKVMSGIVDNTMSLYNMSSEDTEKIGHIFIMKGKTQTEVSKIGAGDIGVVTKLSSVKTGDTLTSPKNKIKYAPIIYPRPCLQMTVVPKAKGDEEKISSGIHKLMEEDLTCSLVNNVETKELVLNCMGEMHADVIVSKLKGKFGVDVDLATPKTPYRETIRKTVKAEGKHKKQSGGHGQYGHVWIEFSPGEETDLTFETSVVGGSVPKNFFPAVEKGLRESVKHGVLAGYPVVNLKANLYDGSYHPVDSSEMSFKVAASLAYKNGLANASPVLMEPVGLLKVLVPGDLMGDIIGNINKRRGRILGMNPAEDDYQEIEAEVPMAEMYDYAIDLRSMSQGRGEFTFEFVRYEDVPVNLAEDIIKNTKAE